MISRVETVPIYSNGDGLPLGSRIREAVIFDIDRTLLDTSNFEHLFFDHEVDTWWPSFHNASVDAPPVRWVVQEFLACRDSGVSVIAVTSRPECFFNVTLDWFNRHGLVLDDLFMRPNDNRLPDFELKESMLPLIRARWNPLFAFDDKVEIVKMWERNGIPSMLVGPVGDGSVFADLASECQKRVNHMRPDGRANI